MSTHDVAQVKVELARAQGNPAMNIYIYKYIDMAGYDAVAIACESNRGPGKLSSQISTEVLRLVV